MVALVTQISHINEANRCYRYEYYLHEIVGLVELKMVVLNMLAVSARKIKSKHFWLASFLCVSSQCAEHTPAENVLGAVSDELRIVSFSFFFLLIHKRMADVFCHDENKGHVSAKNGFALASHIPHYERSG